MNADRVRLDAVRRDSVRELFVRPRLGRWRRPRPRDLSELAVLAAETDALESFDIHVVGSMLDSTATARDVDLVLRWRPDAMQRSLQRVEEALVTLRRHGLSVRVPVDPSFRLLDEIALDAAVRAGRAVCVWKLDAPEWVAARVQAEGQRCIRPVGRRLVVVHRPLAAASYAGKLPRVDGEPRLRPSVPLAVFAPITPRSVS